ncbi:fluoride efflux transporter CrcB [Actinospica sp.]|jgi:CrcB protein|uniref:fluoride efflux transporter CrcB n=1 Tax=Actinospica sp. TaxID=1872142 RepID=UPI002B881900|nr:fluoride efflux transporter CrcB [Actinospica sp.]HWG22721.1 fluoride efflux transporter CrcB [Actinospica sp.]
MASEADGHPFAARPRRRRQDPRVLAAIALGGFLGGEARYLLGLAFPTGRAAFPATTFAINISGSFILALLLMLILEVWPPTKYIRPLFCTGFCGAYTTFSTWMVDTDRLISAGRYGIAAADVFGSLFAGLAATALGLVVGRAVIAYRNRRRAAMSVPEQHSEPSESEALR